MRVASLCRLPVGVVRWRDPRPALTVIVKATYTLTPSPSLADEQLPLFVDEAGDLASSYEIELPSDFAPAKARADVLVVGHAGGEPATELPFAFRVGGLRKHGLAAAGRAASRIPLLADYLLLDESPEQRVAPRRLHAEGWGEREVDPDYDFSAFNVAPLDQQLGALASNCRISLDGLLASSPHYEGQLPVMSPFVFVVSMEGRGQSGEPVPMRCDTLWIHTDRELCTLTWRGVTPLVDDGRRCLAVGTAAGPAPRWAVFHERLDQAAWFDADEEPEEIEVDEEWDEAPGRITQVPDSVTRVGPLPERDEAEEAPISSAPSTPRRGVVLGSAGSGLGGMVLSHDGAGSESLPFEVSAPAGPRSMPVDPRGAPALPFGGAEILPPPEPRPRQKTVNQLPAFALGPPPSPPPPPAFGSPKTTPPPRPPLETIEANPRATQELSVEMVDELRTVLGVKAPPIGDELPFKPRAQRGLPPHVASALARLDRDGAGDTLNTEDFASNGTFPFRTQEEAIGNQLRGHTKPPPPMPEQPVSKVPGAPFETAPPSNRGARFSSSGHVRPPNPLAPPPLPAMTPPPAEPAAGTYPTPVVPRRTPAPPEKLAPASETARPSGTEPPPPEDDEEQGELLTLERYAAIKVALMRKERPTVDVLAEHGLDERRWRIQERRRTTELSRAAAEGNLSMALALRSAMLDAQRKRRVERHEDGLDDYVELRARLQDVQNPAPVLLAAGMTTESWEAMSRDWSRRAMEDRELATVIHEKLVAAKRRLRRLRDRELANKSRST